jgi:predicted tellurium resistance membrane protein TerC
VAFNGELVIALLTLSTLEIVLGADNLVFISIAVGRLPAQMRPRARRFGLALACVTRCALLFVLAKMARLDDSHLRLFTAFGKVISLRDLIMVGGGVFLLIKGTMEIRDAIWSDPAEPDKNATASKFLLVILQIAIIDIVFSIDSVITAVGMVRSIPVMISAIILAVLVMIFAANPVGDFIDNNPTIRMLALAFIMLIGVVLIGEGIDVHVQRGYIYFAMAFSAVVELLNLKAKREKTRRYRRRAGDSARAPKED